MKKLLTVALALCLALSLGAALADQTLEGDANVDQRNYCFLQNLFGGCCRMDLEVVADR